MSEQIDWWAEVTTGPPPAPATPPYEKQYPATEGLATDWWKEITTPTKPVQELRAADPSAPTAKGNFPSGVADRLDLAAPNLVIGRASLAPNPEDQIKRYAEHFNAPTKYFGIVDGEIVRWVPEEGVYAKVVPTMGGQTGFSDTALAGISQTAAGAGPAAPQVAGLVTGVYAGPTGASVPLASGAAALTDWARQALDKAIAGEPLNPFDGADYNVGSIAGQAAEAGLGQLIGVGVTKYLNRNPIYIQESDRLATANKADQMKWQALEAEAERRGVHLSAGQITGLRSLMTKERQLSTYQETMDDVYRFRDVQRDVDIPAAYYDELAQTAPRVGREEAIGGFRDASDKVIRGKQAERAEMAKKIYGEAYDAFPVLDSPVLRSLSHRDIFQEAIANARKIADAKGQLLGPVDAELTSYAREAASLGKMEMPEGGVAAGLRLRTWDQVKRGLDDIISANRDQQGKLTAYGEAVNSYKRELVSELDKLTGGPEGLYAVARRTYGEGSEAVDMVLDGGVGVIQKMSGPDRVNMVTRVFNGRGVLPEEISRMRAQYEEAGQLDAWNKGLSAHLSQVLDDAMKSVGVSGNLGAKLYKELSSDKLQHDAMIAAMGKPQADSMKGFLDVLQAASRSLPEGSRTATDLGSKEGGVGGFAKFIGKTLSPQTYMQLGDNVLEGIGALREPSARIKLFDYLFTDKGMKAISNFKMLSPTEGRSIVAISQILTDAGVIGAKEYTGVGKPRDRMPQVGASPAAAK